MRKLRIYFVALFLMVLYSSSNAATVLLDRVVAVVNSEVITWSELYRAMEEDAIQQVKDMKEEERLKIFKENEATFLENLINLKLQLQEAKNVGLRVGDDEVNEAIDNIRKKYSMSDAEFKESLKKEGYTYDEYRKKLQEQILVGKVVNGQIKSKLLVSDEEVQKFLAENKNAVETSEGYRISQIFFKKPKTDEDKGEMDEKVAAVVAKLKAGQNFSDLAKQYSEDASGNSGGDLGVVKKDALAKEFSDALSKIKPGEFTEPFSTDKGLHILKLEEIVDRKSQAEIREEGRKILLNKIFIERYNAWIKSLREKAYIEVRL